MPVDDPMDDDAKADAVEGVRFLVRAGLSSKAEIVDEMRAQFVDDELDVAWLRAAVELEWARHDREQSTWPERTDCDRLAGAFAELRELGVVAAWSSEYTVTSATAALRADFAEAGGRESDLVGFCVCCGQDIEVALDGGGLGLAFRAAEDDASDDVTVEVGRLVFEALRAAGFDATWAGTAEERIVVQDVRWQLRRDGGLRGCLPH